MKLTPEQHKEHSQKVKEGQARSNKKIGRPRKIDHKKITEATLLIEKDITENKLYGYGIVASLLDGVKKIFPEISESDEDIIIDIILDNLEKKE
jgi:hypothetical protein